MSTSPLPYSHPDSHSLSGARQEAGEAGCRVGEEALPVALRLPAQARRHLARSGRAGFNQSPSMLQGCPRRLCRRMEAPPPTPRHTCGSERRREVVGGERGREGGVHGSQGGVGEFAGIGVLFVSFVFWVGGLLVIQSEIRLRTKQNIYRKRGKKRIRGGGM